MLSRQRSVTEARLGRYFQDREKQEVFPEGYMEVFTTVLKISSRPSLGNAARKSAPP